MTKDNRHLGEPFQDGVFFGVGVARGSFAIELHVNRTGLLTVSSNSHDGIVDETILERHLETEGAIGIEFDGATADRHRGIRFGSTINNQLRISNEPEFAGTDGWCGAREACARHGETHTGHI